MSFPSTVLPSNFAFNDDDASLDPLAGGTANGKEIWTPDQIAAYLNRTGGGWGTGPNEMLTQSGNSSVITFGFHNDQDSLFNNGYVYESGGNLFGLAEYFNFAAFNEAQRAATREAIQYWDDLIAPSFVETDSDHADINYANLASAPGTQAYSRIPTLGLATVLGGQVAGIAGDVWVSASQASNFNFFQNGYGLNTLVHETGHSLGLSHPGGYNFGPNFSATYMNGAEYAQDARNYSIMSYWNPRDLGTTSTGVKTRDFNWELMQIAYGSTPMIHDILAIQKMYGADLTTRTGDTVYGFNSTAGRDAFDFTKNAWPTMTIYDAGGNDTLDASGYGVNQVIDLTPGSLSSIGGVTLAEAATKLTIEQINANRAADGLPPIPQAAYDANMAAFYSNPDYYGRLTDNVGIAYGTIIENAIGGRGNDTIVGNDADNKLIGNAGNDSISGGNGNDFLIGGVGNDKLDGGTGVDTASYADAGSRVTVDLAAGTASGGDGNDTLVSIENVVGSAFGDTFVSDLHVSNVIDGGAGSDTVSYAAASTALKIDLVAGYANGFGATDKLISIENVIAGSGDDRIIGSNADNIIRAGAGYDVVTLGGGNDTYVADQGATLSTKAGMISLDIITDFTAGQDKIDLSGLGALNFRNDAANKNVGDLTYKTYDSVNGAERALGIDIHSHYTGDLGGPVTVVFADTDHKAGADMAIILLNHNGVSAGDFLLGH